MNREKSWDLSVTRDGLRRPLLWLPCALADEEPKAAEPKAADGKAGRATVGVAITTERLMAHVTWLAALGRKGRGT